VAGIPVSSSMITELHPMMKWSLSIIAGGGAAAAVQSMTVTSRLVSSLTTGGIANPVVSTTEAIFATILSIIAILLPIFALIITIYLCYRLLKLLDKRNSLTKTTVQLEN
jgi:hypothetical protein